MSYTKTPWVNNSTPAINASNLNKIEQGIYDAQYSVDNLPKSMVLRGTIGTGTGEIPDLPTNAAEGDVYFVHTSGTYASQAANTGDLFVKRANDWLLIPSGNESRGVTQIIAGSGLSGGTITGVGTLSIDSSYIAQYGANPRNGLMESSEKQKLATLANVAVSGEYDDLLNTPEEVMLYSTTGQNVDGAMTQKATSDELDTKSDVGHTHQTSDVINLNSYLATDGNNNFVKAANNTHVHGNITNDGKILNQTTGNMVLVTETGGAIKASSSIPNTCIEGYANDFTADRTRLTSLETRMPSNNENAAAEGHSHLAFNSETEEGAGFVPNPGEDPSTKILTGTGWSTASSAISSNEQNEFVQYTNIVPTSENTDGLKVYVGSTDPVAKYDGWIYFITG